MGCPCRGGTTWYCARLLSTMRALDYYALHTKIWFPKGIVGSNPTLGVFFLFLFILNHQLRRFLFLLLIINHQLFKE